MLIRAVRLFCAFTLPPPIKVSSDTELRNHQAMRQQLAASALCEAVYVPRIFEEHCAPGILAIEWMGDAMPLDQLKTQAHREQAARIVRMFATHSLFHNRMHHGDPHSGNFLARIVTDKDGNEQVRLVLLDFGVVHTKSAAQMEALEQLCAGLVRNDLPHCAAYLYCLLVNDNKTRARAHQWHDQDARTQRLRLWAAIYLLLVESITALDDPNVADKQAAMASIMADFHRTHVLVLNQAFVDLDLTVVALNNTIRGLMPESNVLSELWGSMRDMHYDLGMSSAPPELAWDALQKRLATLHDRLFPE
jgi:predicted unusual protein kinase regulating ubiquinone biosynthesis (AarF/ABC1/UbiB family)